MPKVDPSSLVGADLSSTNALFWATKNVRVKIGNEWQRFSINRMPYLYPFLLEPYSDICDGGPKHIVWMKGRKVAATTAALNIVLYNIDRFAVSALFGLPKERHLRDLVNGVFDPLVQHSPHVASMFRDTDNERLKVGHKGSLYFRGTQSEEGVEILAVGCIIRDELDQMDQKNAARMLECMSGSFRQFLLDLGHPQYPDQGIHSAYQDSTLGEWNFTCPHCHTRQPLCESIGAWLEVVDFKERGFRCRNCGKPISKEGDIWAGRYVPVNPGHRVKGYHIPQLLSPTVDLEKQISEWELAQGVPFKVQNFVNNVLGLPHSEADKKLTPDDIRDLMIGPPMAGYGEGGIMGVDVGNGLHFWVQEGRRLIRVGIAGNWEDIESEIAAYRPKGVVIDANPELHMARRVVGRLRERGVDAWLCIRSAAMEGRRKIDEESHTITVNITEQMDRFFAALQSMELPSDMLDDAIEHLCAPIRHTKKSAEGVVRAYWSKGTSHFADAGCYANELADVLVGGLGAKSPIISPPLLKSESQWRSMRWSS